MLFMKTKFSKSAFLSKAVFDEGEFESVVVGFGRDGTLIGYPPSAIAEFFAALVTFAQVVYRVLPLERVGAFAPYVEGEDRGGPCVKHIGVGTGGFAWILGSFLALVGCYIIA
jgi:hypothetical protein